ncbi:hypothetical protein D8B35_08165 [Lactococcus laudensis]|nr:hypothetical protein [Lactococcus laudensis]
MAKFTYRVVIAPNLTAVSFVAMPSARKIYLKSYQKQFLEVPFIVTYPHSFSKYYERKHKLFIQIASNIKNILILNTILYRHPQHLISL